ncbi:MAG: hypothetical protein LBM93_03870 [Oscillospiraceae bacterium]|jgi:hypothetical protein|nr:hypothetical protein [Oscillospiraceae bacterium]
MKKIISTFIVGIFALNTVFAISANTIESAIINDGIENGVIVDYDAYQAAHPESFISIGDGPFSSLQDIIESYEQSKTQNGISAFSTLSTNATVPRTFSKTVSGVSNYDKNSSNNSWTTFMGYLNYLGVDFASVYGLFRDELFDDDVKTRVVTAPSHNANIAELSCCITTGTTNDWSGSIGGIPSSQSTSTPWVTLVNNNATFSALARMI